MNKHFTILPLLAVLLSFSSGAQAMAPIDRALEDRIHAAVSPVASSMKLVRDNSEAARSGAGVRYANEKNCQAAQVCTVLVVYYTKGKNCGKEFDGEWGFVDVSKEGGNMRNYYNTKHKDVCYSISTHNEKDARAVEKALKKKM